MDTRQNWYNQNRSRNVYNTQLFNSTSTHKLRSMMDLNPAVHGTITFCWQCYQAVFLAYMLSIGQAENYELIYRIQNQKKKLMHSDFNG